MDKFFSELNKTWAEYSSLEDAAETTFLKAKRSSLNLKTWPLQLQAFAKLDFTIDI
jgi:hypothetical protein